MTRRHRRGTARRARGYELVSAAIHPDDKPPEAGPWITIKCRQGKHAQCPGCDCEKCHPDADLTGLRQPESARVVPIRWARPPRAPQTASEPHRPGGTTLMIGDRDCPCPLLRFARERERLLGDAFDSEGPDELCVLTVARLRREHGCRGVSEYGACRWESAGPRWSMLRLRDDVPLLNRARYEKQTGQYL